MNTSDAKGAGRLGSAAAWGGDWFWRRHVACVFIIVIAAACLNFIVNPFRLYVFDLFEPVELGAHEVKGDLVAGMVPLPEAIILGSSRVMSMNPETVKELTGKSCFNFGLPSAMAEDYYACIRYARECCGAPVDTVIV